MRNLLILILGCVCFYAQAQEYSWKCIDMGGTRTGCVAASAENIGQALGCFRGEVYVAPNGNEFPASSSVAAVAAIVLNAQPAMASVKKVIGHSAQAMHTAKRETMLSRWFVDIVMNKVSDLSDKKVDVGICNFGGIRVDMPEGDIILDDILSMFPFKNSLAYLELPGRKLREIFEKMAKGKFEAVGGVKILVEDKKLTSVLIGGEPLDDGKVYGVATISFLLHGGDGLTLADGAGNLQNYDVYIKDVVLEYLSALKAEGKSVTGNNDVCVTIR